METSINTITYRNVSKALRKFGYKTTKEKKSNANGVDMFAVKDSHVLSVEIKTASKVNNSYRIRKVEKSRLGDDMIAIAFPNGYVLLEPMKQHLKSCNKSGDRFIFI